MIVERAQLVTRARDLFPHDPASRRGYFRAVLLEAKRQGARYELSTHHFQRVRIAYGGGPPLPARASDKARWGPPLWAELHERPGLAGDPPDAGVELRWLADFAQRIPCGECRMHWLELVAALPPDLSSREAYWRWTVRAHNAVNERVGKERWSYEVIRGKRNAAPDRRNLTFLKSKPAKEIRADASRI